MNDKTIWKYKLNPVDVQTIKMPEGSEILSCQMQNDEPNIWVLVDPEKQKVERVIELIGTGNKAFETANVSRVFIDTIQMHHGKLIFHVFERVLKNA